MKKLYQHMNWPLLSGLIVGLLSLMLTVHLAAAAPARQDGDEEPAEPAGEHVEQKACQECHLDIKSHWQDSPHAHAYDDPIFQTQWTSLGKPGECLACHTTNYQPATGEYDAEGIACEACHGEVTGEHPPEIVSIKADTEYCGTCHTTTLGEWHQTGHATAEIGCMDCHDPHSQGPLFEVADDLCINCHKDSMGDYLEDLHIEEGIGCVDCHALVIPPEEMPQDGIVPTGHAFNITAGTCVACHTDALHAGFHLPGYEDGAKNVTDGEEAVPTLLQAEEAVPEEGVLSHAQQIQALETALASQNVTLIFQGALVGLALGGTTAWFVSQNIRARQDEEAGDGQK
jgi:predicted CXXCH cytochrome family protein